MNCSTTTICQLLHGLEVGGAEVLAARLARQLRERYRFVFVCLDQVGSLGRELADEGFTVHCLKRRDGLDLRCARRLGRLYLEEGVNLIHTHQYTPFSYGSMARAFSKRSLPLLFTEHGRHFPDVTSRKRRLANQWLLRPSDRVVGVGQAVRQALIQNEGFRAERVGVIYNGIPLERFASVGPSGREEVRRRLGLSPDSLVLALVARLDYLKDHATALRALGRVAAQRPDVQLLLVGEGTERAKVERQVAELGLANHVQMLGQRSDVPEVLQAADIILLTSISEGIPLTLIEAMAAGLPVVATNVGGVGEVIADGVTGWLAPSGDDAALSHRVVELAGDPEARHRMGRLGQARARALFSESRMHSAYVEQFDALLNSGATALAAARQGVSSRWAKAEACSRPGLSVTLGKGVE